VTKVSGAVEMQTQVAVVSVLAHRAKLGDPDVFMREVQKAPRRVAFIVRLLL